MVDRVARATFRIRPDEAVPEKARLATVRGIAAMRDPNEAMLVAGYAAYRDRPQQDVVWRAMIDAALKE